MSARSVSYTHLDVYKRQPYNLSKDSADPVQREFAEMLKRDYIDKGYLGKGSGRGFYDYR